MTKKATADQDSRTGRLKILLFVVFGLPVFVFWIYCIFIHPSHNYFIRDTEFQYFMNSLAVFKGAPYVYVDHPGTPVEVIGSIILGFIYLGLQKGPEVFVTYVLSDPGLFMDTAHYFMVVIHLVCLCLFFVLSLRPGRWTNAIPAAAFSFMYFALHPLGLGGSVLWNHNAFSFPVGTLLLLLLFHHLTTPTGRSKLSSRVLIALGLGSGILAAITIYLAAWVLGTLASIFLYYRIQRHPWVQTVRAMLLFAGSSVVGFFVAVLPVIPRMRGFWAWIYSIITHQSNYLSVPQHQSLIDRLTVNSAELLQLLPSLAISVVLTLALAAVALALQRTRFRERPGLWALAGGLSVQLVSLLVVFLDRPLRAYYLLSIAAIIPVLALVVFRIYESWPPVSKALYWAVSVAVFVGLLVNTNQSVLAKESEISNLTTSETLIPQIIRERADETGRAPQDVMVLWMNGSYSTCWALWSGNHRAGEIFSSEIMQICPNQFEFGQRVLTPWGKIPLNDTDWDIIFTCEKYLDIVYAKDPGAAVTHYPSIEWNCGKMAVALNK